MRLLSLVLIASLVSAAVVFGFGYAISEWTPCGGEGLACNMDNIVGMIVSLAMTVVSLVVFGIAVLWRQTKRAVDVALVILLIPVFALFVIALQQNSLVNDGLAFHWRAVRQLLQFVAAPSLAVLIQWAILRMVVMRGERHPRLVVENPQSP